VNTLSWKYLMLMLTFTDSLFLLNLSGEVKLRAMKQQNYRKKKPGCCFNLRTKACFANT
jgi:hypothetical protein